MAFILLVMVGCNDPPPSHQKAWEEHNITDYTMKQRRLSFCAYVDQTMIVTVESGDMTLRQWLMNRPAKS